MRPAQKSNRNRGKNNRPKTMGNVVNRVFESAGPEGKVRGTPQQIIEKYEQLARDSQTAGDRVTAENFLQHAEHYLRLLSAAQAEQQTSQPQQGRNDGQQGRDNDDDQPYYPPQRSQNDGQGGGRSGGQNGGQANGFGGGHNGNGASYGGGALETIDASEDADPLVITPEAEQPKAEPAPAEAAAEAPRARAPRRRRPRRDKPAEGGEGGSGGDAPAGSPDSEPVPG